MEHFVDESILNDPEFGLSPDSAEPGETAEAPEPAPTTEEIYAQIAALVRQNARDKGRVTDIASIEALIPPAEADAPPLSLEDMVQDAQYQDIRPAFDADGAVYLYSADFISPENAERKAAIETLQARIAERVRSDSRNLAKLTPLADFDIPPTDSDAEAPAFSLDAMLQDERYSDLRSITIPTGAVYLFSERYVTEGYAKLLARAETRDPILTIVETVRDDSRIYPRPTKLATFADEPFGIAASELDSVAERLLSMPEYEDIKKTVTSNGVTYLYSAQYMPAGQAEYLAEWTEVGRLENP